MPQTTRQEWDTFMAEHPEANFHQTTAWGELKSQFGWDTPIYIRADDSGAQMFFYRLPLGFCVAYIPYGPVGKNWQELWIEVDRVCRERRAVFLMVDPDVNEPADDAFRTNMRGFRRSPYSIQQLNTMYLDLCGTDEECLKRVYRTHRQYLRRAKEKGVTLRSTDDVSGLYHLLEITSERHAFELRDLEYYQKAYDLFVAPGNGALFEVVHDGNLLAAWMLFIHGKRIWAMFCGSVEDKNVLCPNHLLYWDTMRWAAERGFETLDLMGIGTNKDPSTTPEEELGGVYKFKKRFGAQLVRSVGSWDRVYNPVIYYFYTIYRKVMPHLDQSVFRWINKLRKK